MPTAMSGILPRLENVRRILGAMQIITDGEFMRAQTASAPQLHHVMLSAAKADSRTSSRSHPGLLASSAFAALLSLTQSGPALAATPPGLGSTATYGVVSSTFTNSNTAPQTIINGDVALPPHP